MSAYGRKGLETVTTRAVALAGFDGTLVSGAEVLCITLCLLSDWHTETSRVNVQYVVAPVLVPSNLEVPRD